MMGCITLILFVTLNWIAQAGDNNSRLPSDILRKIVRHVPPGSLPNLGLVNHNHHQVIQEYYSEQVSKLLKLALEQAISTNYTWTNYNSSNFNVAMSKHSGDTAFDAFLKTNFPSVLPNMRQQANTCQKNKILYDALVHGLNISESKLIPETISFRSHDIRKQTVGIQYLSQFITNNSVTFPNLNCAIWSECVSEMIDILSTNPNVSLDAKYVSEMTQYVWNQLMEIIVQVAYYHYQRDEINLFEKSITLGPIIHGTNKDPKGLFYDLKHWVFDCPLDFEDTYFVAAMVTYLRAQRDDWYVYSLYDMLHISYTAQISFAIWILLIIGVAVILLRLCVKAHKAIVRKMVNCIDHVAKMEEYLPGTLPSCRFFGIMLVASLMGMVTGVAVYFYIAWVAIKLCLKHMKKWFSCLECFYTHSISFQIAIICQCAVWSVILFSPLFVIPPI